MAYRRLYSRLWVLLVVVSLVAAPLSATASSPEPPKRWRPAVGDTWQWQLDGDIDRSFDVDIYDIDLFDVSADTVAALQADGRRVICYISVGTVEDWRPDAADFPTDTIGAAYDEWPGERWLDIRAIDRLAPVLLARFDLCREKGFDGIEPDNVDGFTNDTGFDLSSGDQARFLGWLVDAARERGLSIGLKNAPELVAELVDDVDWAITEDCYVDEWCEEMRPVIEADKPVFMAEYTDQLSERRFARDVCPFADELGFSAILKGRDLDAERVGCTD